MPEFLDLRIVFLVLLFGFLIFYKMVFPSPGLDFLWDTLKRITVLLLGLGVILVFVLLITRQDPMPYVRLMAYYAGLGELVEFEKAIPVNLAENLEVAKIEKKDTDADGFDEWIVFYRFDKGNPNSPIKGVIYDNDRGNPAIIFPYGLSVPDRNYLSKNPSGLNPYPEAFLESVAQDQNGPNGTDIPELVVNGGTELSIFRFQQNSQPSEEPRDTPARYQAIGFFQGNGGTTLATNQNSGEYQVTVIDPTGYERSQLAARAIYGLHWQINEKGQRYQTFLDPLPPLGSADVPQIAAPVMSTVDFFPAPPGDVLNTPYPEKMVLAFYTATCGRQDDTLCLRYNSAWKPQDFLTGEAAGNTTAPGYFGLPSLGGNQNIQVSRLEYFPQVETQTSRPTLTGQQPQASEVEITFTVNNGPQQRIRYGMRLVNGQWKIGQVIPLPAVESSTQISSAP